MKLTLGFSPCPNDTFIFDALVNEKIDVQGFKFDVMMEDVETLNRWAMQEKLDITKISYGVLPRILPAYRVLDAGGALGKGVGPLLVAKQPIDLEDVSQLRVALPGANTTAHMLFTLAFPDAQQKQFLVFHDIEDAVLRGDVDCGVIIHENRFTYAEKGLHKLLDLGEFWEHNTKSPIPLGGIVMNRRFDPAIMAKIDALIRESVAYSWKQYPVLSPFVREHAQEMSEDVMRQHINLYVNEYSSSLGQEGRSAVWQLLEVSSNIVPQPVTGAFEVFM
ncbi:MAG: 1,4-dihydroxy-6-naphthoate synthase [Chitinophagaceae bacterium]|jgi:1,4-dihydroxy-6-naphthoate synthase